MMNKKVLILGKSGQLGNELQVALLDESKYDVYSPDEKDADISIYPKLEKIVDDIKPDIIVNCAAATNVDACEKNISNAYLINSDGAENCAKAALKSNSFLIHISTDYVYDGKTGMEKISHKTHVDHERPLNNYGLTKLQGEEWIQYQMHEAAPQSYLILRTSGLYSKFGKNNFLNRMEEFIEDKESSENFQEPFNIICDQWYCPTSAKQLAQQIRRYIDFDKTDIAYIINELGNVLNACNLGFISPYLFLSEYLIMRKKENLLKHVRQITFDEYFFKRDIAKRPLNARLDNEAERKFGSEVNSLTSIEEALEEYVRQIS